MKDKGEVAYVLSFTAGKEFDATTRRHEEHRRDLYVYDQAGKEVGKDDSPGPKCSVKVTPAKDGKYKFVIKNAGGQHGDLRGNGRRMMPRRLSERPEDSSGSLVARITLGGCRPKLQRPYPQRPFVRAVCSISFSLF
jgi:hypothetical protein